MQLPVGNGKPYSCGTADIRAPGWEATPFRKPPFLKMFPSYFLEPLTKDYPSVKTTFSENFPFIFPWTPDQGLPFYVGHLFWKLFLHISMLINCWKRITPLLRLILTHFFRMVLKEGFHCICWGGGIQAGKRPSQLPSAKLVFVVSAMARGQEVWAAWGV